MKVKKRQDSFINNIYLRRLPNVGRVSKMSTKKTNPQLVALIFDLKAKTRETEAPIWRDIALRLEKPKSNWAEANLSRLEMYATDGETVLVPGKVLAAGDLTKKLTVAAYDFSDAAKAGIHAAGGKTVTLRELMESNPNGTKVKILR